MPGLIKASHLYPVSKDSICIKRIKALSNKIWDKFMSYNLNDTLIDAANDGKFKRFFFMTSMAHIINEEFNKQSWFSHYKDSYKKDLYTRLVLKAETELTKAGYKVTIHTPENEDNTKTQIEISWIDAKPKEE